jgi:hypothetical protein
MQQKMEVARCRRRARHGATRRTHPPGHRYRPHPKGRVAGANEMLGLEAVKLKLAGMTVDTDCGEPSTSGGDGELPAGGSPRRSTRRVQPFVIGVAGGTASGKTVRGRGRARRRQVQVHGCSTVRSPSSAPKSAPRMGALRSPPPGGLVPLGLLLTPGRKPACPQRPPPGAATSHAGA